MNRYLTQGVNANIPLAVQLSLWQLYDSIPRKERDWLQIFRITPEEDHLKILHETHHVLSQGETWWVVDSYKFIVHRNTHLII